MTLSLEQGKAIVAYARETIELSFKDCASEVPEILKDIFTEERGVFVTLHSHPDHKLRGCIGYPEPIMPLGKAVKDAAKSAAFRDPRFPPVKEEELGGLVVEVSVLTKPELIQVEDPRDYPKHVVVGRDGLIVEHGFNKGLLLPQVPVEWKWDAEEFLSHTCEKAGLTSDMWLDREARVFSFTAQIFTETAP